MVIWLLEGRGFSTVFNYFHGHLTKIIDATLIFLDHARLLHMLLFTLFICYLFHVGQLDLFFEFLIFIQFLGVFLEIEGALAHLEVIVLGQLILFERIPLIGHEFALRASER